VVTAGRAIAGFDSASGMTRVLAAAVEGRDAPLLAQYPAPWEPAVDLLAAGLERLPRRAAEAVYRWSGWLDAIPPKLVPQVRSDQLAEWVVRQYPQREYPVVFIGSSNGAVAHLAAALRAPWLPQTMLLAVRHGGIDPDDPAADMREMAAAGRDLLAANPDLELHHMHDPSQDRLMIARMTYFRVKFLRLPAPYRLFLERCLAPGGTLVLVDCTLTWPVTAVGERHFFQFGAPGGISAREFREGGASVTRFLSEQGSGRARWSPPPADKEEREAEWGFAPPLREETAAFAAGRGLAFRQLRFGEPEDPSPLIADLFRDWYSRIGRPAGDLLVSSFLLMDPVLTMRIGSVPYWSLFGGQPSLDRLAGYLARTMPYDDIRLAIFPHGTVSANLPGIGQWRSLLRRATNRGEFVALDPGLYPRHFRSLTGFHRELSHLPAATDAPRLNLDDALSYLAAHASACGVILE
jgi:hypothetical protein